MTDRGACVKVAQINGWFWRFCVAVLDPKGRAISLPAVPFWRLSKAQEFAQKMSSDGGFRGCRFLIFQRDGMSRRINAKPIEQYWGRG